MGTRGGTASLGHEYEVLVPALFALRLLQHADVSDFTMQSNVKNLGAIDDLVIWIKMIDGEEKNFTFQLKHKENDTKKLQASSLDAEKGHFAIQKYREDFYEKLNDHKRDKYHFIIYTNLDFDADNGKRLDKFQMSKLNSCPGSQFFNVAKNCDSIYGFQLKCGNDQFFEKFSLYTSQRNVTGFSEEIKRLLSETYFGNDDVATIYTDFFRNWYYKHYLKRKLTADMVKTQLLLLLLKPDFPKLSQFEAINEEACRLIELTLKEFDITIFEDSDEELVVKYLKTSRLQNEDEGTLLDGKNNNIILANVDQLTPELRDKVSCFCHKQPMIVKVTEDSKHIVYSAINLIRKKENGLKIVLVGEEVSKDIETRKLFEGMKIFRNLHDLSFNNNQLFHDIINNLQVSLQGRKKISLRNLIELDEEVANIITASDVVKMLQEDFVIGEKKEKLPQHYMTRKLFKIVKGKETKNAIKSRTLVEESKISSELRDRLNLLCAQPGMGKTTMMNYLKNNCSSTHWAIKIDFNKHQSIFDKTSIFEEILEYFLNFASNQFNYNIVTIKLRDIFIRKLKCFFFWDGLDELNSDLVDRAVKFIKELDSRGFQQWISFRPNLKKFLEDNFGQCSFDIEEIDIGKQHEFIRNRLKEEKKMEEIEQIIGRLYHGTNLEINNVVLGTPLQLFMITDVLLRNLDKPLEFIDEISVLSRMYRHFVLGKFQHYLHKVGVRGEYAIATLLKDVDRLKVYKMLALQSCFKSDLLANYLDSRIVEYLQDDSRVYLRKFREEGDYWGIIVNVNCDNSVIFEHATYMEFFAAWWMSENLKLISSFKSFIFKEEYVNVRFFFDMLLAEQCSAHMAILYRNFEKLEQISDCQEDIAGRTPLHLACSWGIPHPLVEREPVSTNETTNFPDVVRFAIRTLPFQENVSKHSVVIKKLAEKFDIEKRDILFKWNAVQYADATLSLSALEGITSTGYNIDFGELESFDDFYLLSYYCVEYDYQHLFRQVVDITPFFYVDRPYRTLFDHACELMRKNICNQIKKCPVYREALLKVNKIHQTLKTHAKMGCSGIHCDNDDYPMEVIFDIKKYVNSYDSEGNLMLNVALGMSCLQTVRLLVKDAKANVNQNDINGKTAKDMLSYNMIHEHVCEQQQMRNDVDIHFLCLAARKGDLRAVMQCFENFDDVEVKQELPKALTLAATNSHLDILEYLVAEGGNINQCDSRRQTLLMELAESGNLRMVKVLIERYHVGIDLTDRFGETAVLKALKRGKLKVVEYLIEKKAKIKQAYRFQKNILNFCIKSGYFDIFKLLIEKYQMTLDVPDESGNTELLIAAQENRFEVVKYLIEKGVNKHSSNVFGDNLLLIAAAHGNFEIARQLIHENFDLNEFDNNGETAMLKAARNNHFKLVTLLIANGANKNQCNKFGENLLLFAATNGNIDVVKDLIENNNFDINKADRDGESAILKAAKHNYFEIVEYLLDKGANVFQINQRKETLLLFAIAHGKLTVAKELMKKFNFDVSHKDSDGESALLKAAKNNHFEIVDYLIQIGVKVYQDNIHEETLLSYAAMHGNLKIVKLLIEEYDFDINRKDVWDDTALLRAAKHNQYEIVEYLISKGASCRLCNVYGETILSMAAMNGNLKIVQILVKTGQIEINEVDRDDDSPLLKAAKHNHFDVVDYLIQHCANKHRSNKRGETLLSFAALHGYPRIVKQLVEEDNFDINQTDQDEESALLKAAKNNHFQIVFYLIKVGAGLRQCNKAGQTLLSFSALHGNLTIVKNLIECHNFDVNKVDQNEESALLKAAKSGHFRIVEYLLCKGADRYQSNKRGENLFSFALLHGNFKIVQELMEDDNFDVITVEEDEPLLLKAARNNHFDIVDYLIDKGVNKHANSKDGGTLLLLAAYHGCSKMVKSLIEIDKFDINWINKNGESALLKAASKNHQKVVKYLLKKGADKFQCSIDGQNLLLFAARYGNIKIVKLLVEGQFDINKFDKNGESALLKAAKANHTFIVNYLIRKRANLHQRNKFGDSLLSFAAAKGNWFIVKKLIEKENFDINETDNNNECVLLKAGRGNSSLVIEGLLDKGADISRSTQNDETLLSLAALNGNSKLVTKLVETYKLDINHIDKNGNSPLLLAAKSGSSSTIQYLIRRGANILQCNKHGENLLLLTAPTVNSKLIENWVEKHNFDINHVDNQGQSALLKVKNHEILYFLINKGANKRQRNDKGETLLSLEATRGNLELVKELVEEEDLDVNEIDVNENSPMLNAAIHKHFNVVTYLLKRGANKYQCNKEGQNILQLVARFGKIDDFQQLIETETSNLKNIEKAYNELALVRAVEGNNLIMAEYLIIEGANTDFYDEYGRTLLWIAAPSGNLDLVKLLIECGNSDVNRTDRDGNSALLIAASRKYFNIVDFLIEKGANKFQRNKFGKTLLLYAANGGCYELVSNLLEDDNFDVNTINNEKEHAMLKAAKRNSFRIVDRLIINGANQHYTNRWGQTILHYAALYGDLSLVTKLIDENGCDFNKIDENGDSVLLTAASKNHFKIVKYLISKGADKLHCNKEGCNLLITAATVGNLEMVSELVESNCFDIDAKDIYGERALDKATYYRHQDVVNYLLPNVQTEIQESTSFDLPRFPLSYRKKWSGLGKSIFNKKWKRDHLD